MRAPRRPILRNNDILDIIQLDNSEITAKNLPSAATSRELNNKIVGKLNKVPSLIKNYLKLSAAKTKDGDKGYVNFVGCRNVFPDNPIVNYLPKPDDYSGCVELWLKDVKKGDQFTVSFNVLSTSTGEWKIQSSETAHFSINMQPLYQSIDFYINVKNNYGMALIRLLPEFDNYGSWSFIDVTLRRLSFD
jgi:hypothetical protein